MTTVINMRSSLSLSIVLLLALLAGCASAPEPTPTGLEESGTFTIRQSQVLQAAVGHSGEGTLIFQGWQYTFVFENMQVGVPANRSVELEGTVYNLDTVEDFEGQYTLTKAEIESGGLSGVWGKNDKGVVAHLVAKGQELEIDFQAAGAKFTLK